MSPAGLAPGTRLCDQCRTIVQTAFPGAGSVVAASAAAVQNNGAIGLVQLGAPALDSPQAGPPAFIEGGASVVESFEPDAQSPMSFELYDERSDLREDEDSDGVGQTLEAEADLADVTEDGSSQPRAATWVSSVEANPADIDYTGAGDSLPPEQPGTFTERAAGSLTTRASLFDDESNEPHRTSEEAAADPWENPLPAWDYSHNEWPVLVGSANRRSFRNLRATLAGLVLLASAAGFYLLIYQPAFKEQRTSVPADSSAAERLPAAAEPQASAAESADSNAQPPTSSSPSDSPASADSKPGEAAAREATGSNENGNAQGRFSLQAAAFATRAAADEFAERLRRSGVPAYVVSTDLARRGRWFRVRAGRFNAAADAQRFAAEAQLRAKNAGMSLQLIVCQYEQP